MVWCGREPCQSKCLSTEKLSTCLSALRDRRPKQLYRVIQIFFSKWWKMCLAGVFQVPLIAPLHPFFPYLLKLFNICEMYSNCTVSFKITSQVSDHLVSCSPWLRQCSQNDVNGSLAQERTIGFSCMWRKAWNTGAWYQDKTLYFKYIFILYTKSTKSMGRKGGCHFGKPYGALISEPELCILNVYRI